MIILILQKWISEMASYTKSIDSNHLVEAGLEGFYGNSDTQKNPNFQVGTDFIANNQIPEIDFATVHSYPDQWYLSKNLFFFCQFNTIKVIFSN